MKIRNLGLFVAACQAGSLSAAAARNSMTVQNVSKAVLNLERETGLRLLDRCSDGVEPTAAGRALLPSAEFALRAFAVCEAQASRLASLADVSGSLPCDQPKAGPDRLPPAPFRAGMGRRALFDRVGCERSATVDRQDG